MGAAVIGDSMDITGSKAKNNAINAQTDASNQANATQLQMYNQTRADQEPWRQAGMTALSGIQGNDFMKDWKTDPGYQFQLSEGNKAINAAASARGMGNSGATMKALAGYSQNLASQEYGKAYDRNYSRLSALAGFGNTANSANASMGANYANNVSANQIGLGNASAAATLGQNRNQMQLIGQGASAAAMFSDERLKTEVTEIPLADLIEMKANLKAYAFKYKKDEHGKGDWVGVMAQDLEKSKLGKTLVFENEKGEKQIDTNKVLSMFLATMAEG